MTLAVFAVEVLVVEASVVVLVVVVRAAANATRQATTKEEACILKGMKCIGVGKKVLYYLRICRGWGREKNRNNCDNCLPLYTMILPIKSSVYSKQVRLHSNTLLTLETYIPIEKLRHA